MGYIPIPVRRAQREMGEQLKTQRKLMGLTAEMVAQRAGTTVVTLRKIESGKPVRSDILLTVLKVLGFLDAVVIATDPYQTDVGKLRANERLPKIVRVPRG